MAACALTEFPGAKRYILLPPSECKLLYLYPRGHPECTYVHRHVEMLMLDADRHSEVDWSKLDLEKYPLLKEALFAWLLN